jgi:hypothetical protein
MVHHRLIGIHLDLTDEQKRLLCQFKTKDWQGLIAIAGTDKEVVPHEHGASIADKKLANVMYETDGDLVERIDATPRAREDVAQRITARSFGPVSSFQRPQMAAPVKMADGLAKVGFAGVIASAAVW